MTGPILPPSTPQIDLLRIKSKPLKRELFSNFLPILAQFLQSLNHSNPIKTLKKSDGLVKEDLEWCVESFTKDYEELDKLQVHLEFLNADETIVTGSEIINEFNQFISFLTGNLIDNLMMVFGGISDGLKDDKVKPFLDESISTLKKITITLKLLASGFGNYDTDLVKFEGTLGLFKQHYDILINLRLT